MKTTILLKTKEFLKVEGLKFAVDDLSLSLNISKKTIYKYFTSKEELAKEVYLYIYDTIIDNLLKNENLSTGDFLLYYLDAVYYSQSSLLNVYSLNFKFIEYTKDKLNQIWLLFKKRISNTQLENYKHLRLFIEGSLLQLCSIKNKKEACYELAKILDGDVS